MNHLEKHILDYRSSLKKAMIKLNSIPDSLTLFIVNKDKQLIGSLTDGDIRRGFISGLDMSSPLEKFMKKEFYSIKEGEYSPEALELIREERFRLVPLVNKNNVIKKLYNFRKIKTILPLDTVIMAGGEGKRLRPLTEKMPKPLLKVGSKQIIDHNIDHLCYFGIDNIHLTLRYLGEQIIDFCKSKNTEVNFQFHQEPAPMGTIGSLSLIENFKHDHILILNSDLLTNVDYEDMYKEFLKEEPDILVASVPYHINLPYAIFETDKNKILSFKEKPNYTYFANAGIYIIRKEILSLIPENQKYDSTDLMEKIIKKGLKLKHYPIRSYWLDIGNKEDFQKAQLDISHIDFS